MKSSVGGAAMYPSKDIIQSAVNSKDHTTLVAAGLMKMVEDGHGKAMLKTVEGDPVTVLEKSGRPCISGQKAGVDEVPISNVMQSNGVIDVVTWVLLAS